VRVGKCQGCGGRSMTLRPVEIDFGQSCVETFRLCYDCRLKRCNPPQVGVELTEPCLCFQQWEASCPQHGDKACVKQGGEA
jgi:hypothetical protein